MVNCEDWEILFVALHRTEHHLIDGYPCHLYDDEFFILDFDWIFNLIDDVRCQLIRGLSSVGLLVCCRKYRRRMD